MIYSPTAPIIPTWRQAAQDALASATERDRLAKTERERADGEALANQIRSDLPEIADHLLDGFTPPSNRLIADGYVFQRRTYDGGSGYLVIGRLMPEGTVLFAKDYPDVVFNLASLGLAIEEIDAAFAAQQFEETTKPAAQKLESLLLTQATQTALSMMATLCQRVAKGQELDPEQDLILAMVKYITAKSLMEPARSHDADDVSDIPF